MEDKRGLIRDADLERLIANGRAQEPVRGSSREIDHQPIVRLYLPFSNCCWLLTEVEPDDHDIAFGLCDLGMGFPELGSVWLPELAELRVQGLRVLQDVDWRPNRTLNEYAKVARAHQQIVSD